MGLDQYLRAKTTKREYQGATGACSGLFGLAPDDEGMVEIGYWRKAYDQDNLISRYAEADNGCNNRLIKKEDIDSIIKEAKHILKTHKFDKEDGFDITESTEIEDFISYSTWQSKRKWKDTIRFFTDAKTILKEDPEAEIYYCTWY